MDRSKINQSELKYSCGAGSASVNLFTGRLLFEHPDISIGASSFQIIISHIYNSHSQLFGNINSSMGKRFKLNIEQYVFPYERKYAINGFEEDDYVYVDGSGYIHRFVWYKEITEGDRIKQVYYDTSGTGLTFNIDQYFNREIIDANKNILKFNTDGLVYEIMSGINAKIIKKLTYINGKLNSIYDTRKSARKIEFYYSGEFLSKIKCNSSNKTLNYYYDENGNLTRIEKYALGNYQDIVNFYYNENEMLNYAVDAEDKSALKFEYETAMVSGNYQIRRVSTGTAMLTPVFSEEQPALYLGDNVYSGDNIYSGEMENSVEQPVLYLGEDIYFGDDIYSGEMEKLVIGHNIYMPSAYVKTYSEFSYISNQSTTVTNERGVEIVYFFNNNHFTTSILENIGYENYRTMSKTGGWELSDEGNSLVSLNMKRVHAFTGSKYTIPSSKITNFTKIFEKDSYNLSDSKYKYTEKYILSFWVRFYGALTSDITARFSSSEYNITGESRLDKTPDYSWQYVTMPIDFSGKQAIIKDMEIYFDGCPTDAQIQIADVRIAVGSWTNIILDGAIFDNAEYIGYTFKSVNYPNNKISESFFMTESDIFMTYKNIYHKQEQQQTYFDLVYCGGTKVKSVTNVWFVEKNNTTKHYFTINSEGVANYYNQSKNRAAEKRWCINEIQMRFHYDQSTQKYYYEQKTSIDFTNNVDKVLDVSTASTTYIWINEDGTQRATKDAYRVITHNYYDNYGNITSTEIFNEAYPEGERIITNYGYSNINEELREQPLSCEQNGIIKYYQYNEPWMTKNNSTNGESTTVWSYDDYHDRVTEMRYRENSTGNLLAKNTFAFDYNGRLKSVTDKSNRIYGFQYNLFGEVTKYFENGKLILEKDVERNSAFTVPKGIDGNTIRNADKIIEKRYRTSATSNPDITETIMDKYGRLQTQKNGNDTITFNYQDDGNPYLSIDPRHSNFSFTESNSVAKVTQINDPYEKQTYNYHYDEDNRPHGYSTSGGDGTGAMKFAVNQITTTDTQYDFNSDGVIRTSTIINEDSEVASGNKIYIEPRIYKTKDTDDSFKNGQNEFEVTYKYDDLGRLEESINTEIIYSTIPYLSELTASTVKKYKTNTTLIKELEHKVKVEYSDTGNPRNYVHANISQSYEYDERGNIITVKEIGEGFEEVVSYKNTSKIELDKNVSYKYDSLNRLTTEDNSVLGNYIYDYESGSDKLKTVKKDNTIIKSFSYTNNKRTSYTKEGTYYNISYDNYGNVTRHLNNTITWNSRNLLDKFGSIEYSYNNQGIRFKKKLANGINKDYFLDGNRILGENWSDSSGTTHKIRYFYNAEGIAGLRYDDYNFNFIKDGLGNVSKVMHRGKLIAEYNYDAWGNCTLEYLGIKSERDEFVVENNPFRWKGYYLDLETGLYYINERYYSPELMQYLDADNPENLLANASVMNGLDRNAITVDNPICFMANTDSIFTATELFPDPLYDENAGKSWWDLNWKKAVQWIAFAAAMVISLILIFTPAHIVGVALFTYAMKGAISGYIIGGLIGGFISAVQGNGFMEGFEEGAIYGFINGFTTAALRFCLSQAIGSIAKVANIKCFAAGTLVLTSSGYKAIEDIEVGDMVWAYDEETDERALKEVVRLFRNTTKQLTTVNIDGVEPIVCTPEHPFYILNAEDTPIVEFEGRESRDYQGQWITAGNLKVGHKVLLSNGKNGIISNVETEDLDEPVATYNFEVQDYHTYYVGSEGILVHNACGGDLIDDTAEIIGKAHGSPAHQAEVNRIANEMAQSGNYSKIYLNRSLSTTGVKSGSYLRPDIIGVNKAGGFGLVEVASKTQVMGTTAYNSLQANITFYNSLSNVSSIRFVPWGY